MKIKKNIYVHIGCHKTGTSSLQYFFWNNRSKLKLKGFLYPEIGLGGGYSHAQLANIIKPNNKDCRFDDYRKQFHKEINDSNFKNILLSSEVFLEGDNIANALDLFLNKDEFNIKVIVYLRNQVEWLQSVYNEVVRDPYRRFTGDIFQLREYQNDDHDYEKLLEPWIKSFGEDSLILRPYGNFINNNELLYDFLNVIGVKRNIDRFNYYIKRKNENRRFHPLATEFLKRINRFAMMQDDYFIVLNDLGRISKDLNEKYGLNYTLLTREQIEIIKQKYKMKNSILFEKYTDMQKISLFNNSKKYINLKSSKDSFDAEVQHYIFNSLDKRTRKLINMLIPSISNKKEGKAFIPAVEENNEKRLNEIIFRQRYELRKLYEFSKNK